MSATIAIPANRPAERSPWLFSPGLDLAVFGGSALAAFALLGVGAMLGILDDATPDWAWIGCVLLVDVAHVYSTGFKVYVDGEEFRRRRLLYTAVPIVSYALAFLLYGLGSRPFWTALAYLAVFHFVRQQYGWVALYRGRCGEHDRLSHLLDTVTIYAATVYPLLYWHAHLPRRFYWFLEGDFLVGVPESVVAVATPIYWLVMASYVVRSLYAWFVTGRPNPGKDLIVATTALCWYVGIVALDSDYAFMVTNVIIHGVPYLVLIYMGGRRRAEAQPHSLLGRFFSWGVLPFLAVLWALAFFEEMVWDQSLWHDRPWLFGELAIPATLIYFLVPLLALPQIVHYVLDGFIWRRRDREAYRT